MKAAIEYKSLQQLAVVEEKKESPAGGEVIFSVFPKKQYGIEYAPEDWKKKDKDGEKLGVTL